MLRKYRLVCFHNGHKISMLSRPFCHTRSKTSRAATKTSCMVQEHVYTCVFVCFNKLNLTLKRYLIMLRFNKFRSLILIKIASI